jgi:hypothetical protein
MSTTIDEVADRVYRMSTWCPTSHPRPDRRRPRPNWQDSGGAVDRSGSASHALLPPTTRPLATAATGALPESRWATGIVPAYPGVPG